MQWELRAQRHLGLGWLLFLGMASEPFNMLFRRELVTVLQGEGWVGSKGVDSQLVSQSSNTCCSLIISAESLSC